MEGWRDLARAGFDDSICIGLEPRYDVISIAAASQTSTVYQHDSIPSEEVAAFIAAPPATGPSGTRLQLLRIQQTDHQEILSSAEMFHRWFGLCELDPAILYLITKNSYGFHRFDGDGDGASSTSNTTGSSFFVATVSYVLMWSFHATTWSTNAILMTRGVGGTKTGQATYLAFGRILRLYKDHIAVSPAVLALVTAIQTIEHLDTSQLRQLHFLRRVEAYTGHGPFSYVDSKPVPSLDEISTRAGEVGSVLVNIANQQRHILIVRSLLSFLHGNSSEGPHAGGKLELNSISAGDVGALSWLQSLLPVLEQQLQSTMTYNSYLGERARNQSTVLSHLLTHQDALISTRLADSSREIATATRKDGLVMQQIAAATKKDGEAMKTIAVMTMLFLPGTYFAALFAVPSLQWDRRPVIQDGFGTYWAFTLPATAIVFVAWALLTNWYGVRQILFAGFRAAPKTTKDMPEEKQDQP